MQLLDYQKIIQSSENPSSKISSDEFFLSISKSLTGDLSFLFLLYLEDLQELSSLFLESEKSISKVLSVKAEEIRQLGDKCDSLICVWNVFADYL